MKTYCPEFDKVLCRNSRNKDTVDKTVAKEQHKILVVAEVHTVVNPVTKEYRQIVTACKVKKVKQNVWFFCFQVYSTQDNGP